MYYQNFEELCRQNSVTASKVARGTGISTSTLTSWKQGKYTPKTDKLKLIADYFGVTLEYLMRKEELEWNPKEQSIGFSMFISEEESILIDKYRKADDMQKEMIRRILSYSNYNNK